MSKILIKKIINNILGIFNFHLIRKDLIGVVEKRELTSFQKTGEKYKLYYEGLIKSKNIHTDNFFKQSRHLDLMNLVEIVLNKKIIGDFVEAGCWKGHSSYLISKLISKTNSNSTFHIFDSFEGLSEVKTQDTNLKKMGTNEISKIRLQFASNESFVRDEVLKEFKFVKTYKGWIPEKFHHVENLKVCFVHIDVDLYEPTLQCLEFFFPRLSEGGIIVCDDYNTFEFDGSKKAWDDFFSKEKVKINFAPAMGSSFVVK